MTEHVNPEKTPPSFEEIKARYESGNIGQQAVIRSALAMQTIVDSALDRPVKVDAVIATLKSLVLDIEIATYERIYKISEKAPSAPVQVIISQLALTACDLADEAGRKQANILQLFLEEAKARSAAKQAETVA